MENIIKEKKQCTKCKKIKILSDFYIIRKKYIHTDSPNHETIYLYYDGQCKKCKNDYNKKYRENNKEKIRQYKKRYEKENYEKISAYKRKYYREKKNQCHGNTNHQQI